MKRPSSALGIFLVTLALFGLGCKKGTPNSTISTPKHIVPFVQPSPVLEPHEAVREAVKNFQQVKSFRANVSITTDQGTLAAKLEFMKPNRFRGNVDLGKNGKAELIVVDDSLYMKVNDQKWMALSNKKGSKTIGETMKNALNGDANLQNLGLDPKVDIVKSRDDKNSCDRYTTKLKTADGNTSDVQLCIAAGLPTQLDITTPQGPVHIEYYDYNTVFLIEKPI